MSQINNIFENHKYVNCGCMGGVTILVWKEETEN